MILLCSDGGVRKLPNSQEKGGAYSTSLSVVHGKTYRITEVFKDTTNNRMELLGCLEGILQAINYIEQNGSDEVIIISDSQIVIKGISEWMDGWKSRGWKKADRKPVINDHIWKVLFEAYYYLRSIATDVKTYWIRGHLTKNDITKMTDPFMKIASILNIECDTSLGNALDTPGYVDSHLITEEDKLNNFKKVLGIGVINE